MDIMHIIRNIVIEPEEKNICFSEILSLITKYIRNIGGIL